MSSVPGSPTGQKSLRGKKVDRSALKGLGWVLADSGREVTNKNWHFQEHHNFLFMEHLGVCVECSSKNKKC